MAVSGQIGAVQPQGMSKKKSRYASLVQEQAHRGTATQMVLDRKEQEEYEKAKGLQESQFAFQKEQADLAGEQWQKEYALGQTNLANQQSYWDKQLSQQKKQQEWSNALGIASTAATGYLAFSGGGGAAAATAGAGAAGAAGAGAAGATGAATAGAAGAGAGAGAAGGGAMAGLGVAAPYLGAALIGAYIVNRHMNKPDPKELSPGQKLQAAEGQGKDPYGNDWQITTDPKTGERYLQDPAAAKNYGKDVRHTLSEDNLEKYRGEYANMASGLNMDRSQAEHWNSLRELSGRDLHEMGDKGARDMELLKLKKQKEQFNPSGKSYQEITDYAQGIKSGYSNWVDDPYQAGLGGLG